MSIACTKQISITVKANTPPPFAYFKFDEPGPGFGTAANSMGTGDLITGSGASVQSVAGKLNTTLANKPAFAQATYGVQGQPLANWSLGASFTIRFWWQPTDILAVPFRMMSALSGASHWYVELYTIGSDVEIEFYFETNSANVDLVSPPIFAGGLNQWYHVVCWAEDGVGGGIRINDSIEVLQADISGTAVYPLDGIFYSLFGTAIVVIDEMAFWKQALTPAQITYDYNGGAGRSYP